LLLDNTSNEVSYWGQLLGFGKVRTGSHVVLVRAFKREGAVKSTEVRPGQLKAGLAFYTYDELTPALQGVVDNQKLSDQEKNDAFLAAKKKGVPAFQQTTAGPEHDGSDTIVMAVE
jgi:hypothetical protein